MFSVRRPTRWGPTWQTDPYFWESDQSIINCTIVTCAAGNNWYYETGLSAGFHDYQVAALFSGAYPGDKINIALGYNGQVEKPCRIYCEKSGIFGTIILEIRVYNIP